MNILLHGRVEANEISSVMVHALSTILTHLLPTQGSASANAPAASQCYASAAAQESAQGGAQGSAQENVQVGVQVAAQEGVQGSAYGAVQGSNEWCARRSSHGTAYGDASTPHVVHIHPHLNGLYSDTYDHTLRLRSESLPWSDDSIHIRQWLGRLGQGAVSNRLVIHLGDFINIYSSEEYKGSYNAVITCFFIDTSQHILQYILIIRHILRPGGIWVNLGPLHYHKRGSVLYSRIQVIELAAGLGFEHIRSRRVNTLYTTEVRIMSVYMYVLCIVF